MNIVVVTNQYPIPPSNGNTIPIAGFIALAKTQGHDVSIQILHSEREENSEKFASFECIKDRSLPVVYQELVGDWPVFGAWECSGGIGTEVDLIVASPISVVGAVLRSANGQVPVIALINDVYTSVLRSSKLKGYSFRPVLQYLFRRLRGTWMQRSESAMLNRAACVVVQTQRDKQWAEEIGIKVPVYPIANGVPKELLSCRKIENTQRQITVLVVADFSGIFYQSRLFWFVDEVWRSVARERSNICLRVVGRGLEKSKKWRKRNRGQYGKIEYFPYIEDIVDVYQGVDISVAPIYKEYGFINKVAESLACGIPVIGDNSAFNGMEEAVSTNAAFIASNTKEWILLLEGLLIDDKKRRSSSIAAKQFASKHLQWSSRGSAYQKLIENIMRNDFE